MVCTSNWCSHPGRLDALSRAAGAAASTLGCEGLGNTQQVRDKIEQIDYTKIWLEWHIKVLKATIIPDSSGFNPPRGYKQVYTRWIGVTIGGWCCKHVAPHISRPKIRRFNPLHPLTLGRLGWKPLRIPKYWSHQDTRQSLFSAAWAPGILDQLRYSNWP